MVALVEFTSCKAQTTGSGHLRCWTLGSRPAIRSIGLQATQSFSCSCSFNPTTIRCRSNIAPLRRTARSGIHRWAKMRPRNPNTRIGTRYACDAVVRKTDLRHDAQCLGDTKRLRFPPCFVSPGSTELDLTPSSRPAQYRPSRSYFRFKPGDYFRKNLRWTQ